MFDVGEFVAGVLDLDVSRTDACHPCPTDLAVAQRVQQDGESREVERMLRFDSLERDLVFELA